MKFFRCTWVSLALCAAPLWASNPDIDLTTHWAVSSFADGWLSGASKRYWITNQDLEYKQVFNTLALRGVKYNGTTYWMGIGLTKESETTIDMVDDMIYRGWYRIQGGPRVQMQIFLWKDGSFSYEAILENPYATNAFEAIWLMDYDLEGAADDIAEFMYNTNSPGGLRPTPNASPLAISTAPSTGASYWAAVNNEVTLNYPSMTISSPGNIANNAFARVANSATTMTQFGFVLTPGSASAAATDITVMNYDYSRNVGVTSLPAPNTGLTVQQTVTEPNFPTYAHGGADQIMWITTKRSSAYAICAGAGMLFTKKTSRPLKWNVRTHNLGWTFDFFMDLSNGMSFKGAMDDLVPWGTHLLRRSAAGDLPTLNYPAGYPAAGGNVTPAQLHNFMVNNRDYSDAQRNDWTYWTVDTYVVNWRISTSPSALGVMFDFPPAPGSDGSNSNGIEREAAAIFWPAHAGNGSTWQRREAIITTLHEGGHALNFSHNYSSCHNVGLAGMVSPCNGNSPCISGTHLGTLMSYRPHTNNRNTFNHDFTPCGGQDRNTVNFYRSGPESWVKPGYGGAPAVLGRSWIPPFTTN